MSAEKEIEFLERLYRIEVPTMDQELNRLAERVTSDIEAAAKRAGRDDLAWLVCFFCGRSANEIRLSRCECSFPEAFGCGVKGRRICSDCASAHKQVAAHLETLFASPVVNRVNAKRAQRWRELSRAVRSLYDEDADPTTCPLFVEIAQCDEFDHETDRFRRELLCCFAKAKFIDFQALSRTLRRQQDESLIRSVIRSGFYR